MSAILEELAGLVAAGKAKIVPGKVQEALDKTDIDDKIKAGVESAKEKVEGVKGKVLKETGAVEKVEEEVKEAAEEVAAKVEEVAAKVEGVDEEDIIEESVVDAIDRADEFAKKAEEDVIEKSIEEAVERL